VKSTSNAVAAPWVAALGTLRITLTPPVFNAAECVIFAVTGADKAATLASVLQGERCAERYPSQGIKPRDGALLWLVDRAAASKLSRESAAR
jgi:6-phosphogluconolactonase